MAKVTQIQRNRLFFGQWEYAVSFSSPLARYLRPQWTYERIETNIRQSFALVGTYAASASEDPNSAWHPVIRRYRHLALLKEDSMVALNQWIHRIECDHRLTRQYLTVHIYANDLSFLPHLEQLQADHPNMVYNLRTQQALAAIPDGQIWMNVPKHSFRTYLCMTSAVQTKSLLRDFLQNYGNEVRMSPGLKAWFEHQDRLTSRSTYFVDHNHMTIVTAISIICPGIVGQTVTIHRRPG